MADMTMEEFVSRFVYGDCFIKSIRDILDSLTSDSVKVPNHVALVREKVESSGVDEDLIAGIAALASHASLFSFLAYLDNVRPISDGFAEQLTLGVRPGVAGSTSVTDLNPEEDMHDEFQYLIQQYWEQQGISW